MSYLLSIVVPTRDRYFYLKHLIELIDSFNAPEVELVIQDNSDDNSEILAFLAETNRPDLKYRHHPGQIPVSMNTDLAIGQATGEYVCFIGDDDGVLPTIVDCVRWMKKKGIEALRPAITVYNWPDFIDFGIENLSGVLYFNRFSGRCQEIYPIKALKQMAGEGFPHIYSLPKVYQGIVKRTCLEELFSIGGTFSPGPSPDMAAAVALSFIVKRFVIVDAPVILIGQCRTVGGGERELNGGVKSIETVPFLPQDASENWDASIPRVWCSHTVWPESAVKALGYMNRKAEIKVNYNMILARFIRTHPTETHLARVLSDNKLLIKYYLFRFQVERLFKALTWRVNYLFTGRKTIDGREITIRGIRNIRSASEYLTENHIYAANQTFQNL